MGLTKEPETSTMLQKHWKKNNNFAKINKIDCFRQNKFTQKSFTELIWKSCGWKKPESTSPSRTVHLLVQAWWPQPTPGGHVTSDKPIRDCVRGSFFQRDMRQFIMAIKYHQGTRLIWRIIWSHFRWTWVTSVGLSNFIVAMIVILFGWFETSDFTFIISREILWLTLGQHQGLVAYQFDGLSWLLNGIVQIEYLSCYCSESVDKNFWFANPFLSKPYHSNPSIYL